MRTIYEIQVRGEWEGSLSSSWRPAVTGTINQTGTSDEEASQYPTYDLAFSVLDWIQTEVADTERAEFRIVEVFT